MIMGEGVGIGVNVIMGEAVGVPPKIPPPPPPSLDSFLKVMESVAPSTGATVTWAGPGIITWLPISGKLCELLPVLKSIRIAVRTLAVPPFSPVKVTETTPRSIPPSWEKFLMLRRWPSSTVIIKGEVVIILLLNGWANAKLAVASITTVIKHRAAIFMSENTCSLSRSQLQSVLLGCSVTIPFARCADRGRVFFAQGIAQTAI